MTVTEFDVLQPWPEDFDPLMRQLYDILVDCSALHDFAQSIDHAVSQEIQQLKNLHIHTPSDYLRFMNSLLRWCPTETKDSTWIYTNLVTFYWVFNLDPLGRNTRAQTAIVPKSCGRELKEQAPVTQWLVHYANKMGAFMNTKESWPEGSLETFKKSEKYHVEWYQGPWETFNQFFARTLKEPRKIDGEGDDHVVVSPADCTYKSHIVDVDKGGNINVKGLLWDIDELLSSSDVLPKGAFAGGKYVHSFLAPSDYHHQHAPVSGIVREAKVVQGQCHLQVVVDYNPEEGGAPSLRPVRPLPPPVTPAKNGVIDQDAASSFGYQFLQARGVIVIENENLGYVACVPVGMAQVSSVKTNLVPGQWVDKGDEISWIEFGGSDIIMVFQERANVALTIKPCPKNPPHMLHGQQVIRADYR